jgi:mono/diheme cytochrome c family protein
VAVNLNIVVISRSGYHGRRCELGEWQALRICRARIRGGQKCLTGLLRAEGEQLSALSCAQCHGTGESGPAAQPST